MNNQITPNPEDRFSSGTIQGHGNDYYIGDPPNWLDTYTTPQPETRQVKRTTRTIEKFDPEGKLVSREVITEEEEIFDKQVWPNNHNDLIITCDEINNGTGGDFDAGHTLTGLKKDQPITSSTVTYKNDVPYTLTNGMSISDIVANYNSPDLSVE